MEFRENLLSGYTAIIRVYIHHIQVCVCYRNRVSILTTTAALIRLNYVCSLFKIYARVISLINVDSIMCMYALNSKSVHVL